MNLKSDKDFGRNIIIAQEDSELMVVGTGGSFDLPLNRGNNAYMLVATHLIFMSMSRFL